MMLLRFLCALLVTITPAFGSDIFTNKDGHEFGTDYRRVVMYTTFQNNTCLAGQGACYTSVAAIAREYLEAYEQSIGIESTSNQTRRELWSKSECCSWSGAFYICMSYPFVFGCPSKRRLQETMTNGNPSPPTLSLGKLGQFGLVALNGANGFKWQKSYPGWAADVFVSKDAKVEDPQELLFGSKIYTDGVDSDTFFEKLKLIKDASKNVNAADVEFVYEQSALAADLITDYDDIVSEILTYNAHEGFHNAIPQDFYIPGAVSFENGIAETIVIDIKTNRVEKGDIMYVTGDVEDIIIFRWDDNWACQANNGCKGNIEFKEGSAIVPLGGISMSRIINMAEQINAPGSADPAPSQFNDWGYERPHFEDGTPMPNGKKFGGGFFSGYWFITGTQLKADQAQIIGGLYTKAVDVELTNSAGMYLAPPTPLDPIEEAADENCWRSVGVAADATFVIEMEDRLAGIDYEIEGVKIAIQEKVPCEEKK